MYTILVIDDEERVALSIERSLRPEYRVQVAFNAPEGLKIARRYLLKKTGRNHRAQ